MHGYQLWDRQRWLVGTHATREGLEQDIVRKVLMRGKGLPDLWKPHYGARTASEQCGVEWDVAGDLPDRPGQTPTR